MKKRRYVVCDRDGTLIVSHHYLSDPDLVELLPNAAAALKKIRKLGLGIIVLTNQSPIGRGLFDETRLAQIHDRMTALLSAQGAYLDGIYYCPHLPEDNCECRKPNVGLLERAAWELCFDPRECFVIGDNVCDIEMGARSDATTFLVRTGRGAEIEKTVAHNADFIVGDILEAAVRIEELLQEEPEGELFDDGASIDDYK